MGAVILSVTGAARIQEWSGKNSPRRMGGTGRGRNGEEPSGDGGREPEVCEEHNRGHCDRLSVAANDRRGRDTGDRGESHWRILRQIGI